MYASNARLSCDGCHFESNYAEREGGGVFLAAMLRSSFLTSSFLQNSALGGGGVYITGCSTAAMAAGSLEACSPSFDGGIFSGNQATGSSGQGGGGGGLLVKLQSDLKYGVVTEGFHACRPRLTGVTMENNMAIEGHGGGILAQGQQVLLRLEDVTIYNNKASGTGGGVKLTE